MGTIVSHCSRQRDGTAENATTTTTTSDNACGGCQHAHSETSLQRVKFPGQQPKAEDKVAAVVVTICDGGSYDAMFSAIPQEGEVNGFSNHHCTIPVHHDGSLWPSMKTSP